MRIDQPQYIEAPDPQDPFEVKAPSVFLAGGITNCWDWQSAAVKQLGYGYFAIFNPRRANFPMDDPDAGREQIEWEFEALTAATVIMFWFPAGPSLQPISLYELGRYAGSRPRVVVGVDQDYLRSLDVHVQMELARPGMPVYGSLGETCAAAKEILLSSQPGVLS